MSEMMKLVVAIVVVHAAVLGLILFIVRKLLSHDTLKAVNTVKQVETEVRKKEEGIMRRIDEHEKEFARKKAEADEELQKRRQESEREVRQLKDKIVGDATAESDQIIKRAKQNEEKLKQQLTQQAEEKAVDYAGQIFKLVFSEKMSGDINRQFTSELLDALEQMDATSITVDSSQLEVKASHPLPADQKERLEKLLREKFGAEITVQEKTDAGLLGGLVFKLGSLEVDGSLLARYQEAVSEVKKTTNV